MNGIEVKDLCVDLGSFSLKNICLTIPQGTVMGLIGKNGSLLKTIGTQARLELEEIVEKKVYLDLTVKVEKDWRKKDKTLKSFGYFEENM